MSRRLYTLSLMAACSASALMSLSSAHAQTATLNAGQVQAVDTGAAGGTVPPSATTTRAAAKALKKAAINLIQVQPQSEIAKLPDVNVGEALERLPGISLETDTGEGRFINIRGMDTDLNATTYDGIPLTPSDQSSPLGGARAVAMDAFPAGVIGGVEVVDTPRPDMDADGLGGSINLVPRSIAANAKPFLDATFGGGVENLHNTEVWEGTATVGTSFGLTSNALPWEKDAKLDRPFTIIATYSRYDDMRAIDDVEEDYSDTPGLPGKALSDIQERKYQYNRKRDGEAVTLGYKPDADNSFNFNILDSGYTEQVDKHRLAFNDIDGSNGTFAVLPNGSFESTGSTVYQEFHNSLEKVRNILLSADGHSVFNDSTKLDYRVGWTQGTDNVPDDWDTKFNLDNPDGSKMPLDVIYNNTNPAKEITTAQGVNVNDPSLYQYDSSSNSPSKAIDKEWSAAVDLTQLAPVAGFEGTAKFGFSAQLRTRGVSQGETDYSPNGTAYLNQFTGGGDQIYYNGLYNIGPNAANGPLQNYVIANSAASENTIGDLQAFQGDSENIYAGYGQYDVAMGKLDVLGGLRVEATQGNFRAYNSTTDVNGNLILPLTLGSKSYHYINVFPDVTAKYTLQPDLLLRAAITTAIARPGFDQITEATSVDFSQDAITQGNPNLKPTTGVSFDLALEKYLSDGGIASIGLFDKQFQNYIVTTTQNISNYAGSGETFTSNTFANINGAFVRGVELNYEQHYTNLPSPLDGIGLDTNFTYNSSGGDIRPGDMEPLPETSARNFNVAPFYEKGPFSARVGISYVSQDLFAVGGDRMLDQFASPRLRVDFETGYQITKNVAINFSAKNLTNTPLEFTESEDFNRPIQREFYDQTYLATVHITI